MRRRRLLPVMLSILVGNFPHLSQSFLLRHLTTPTLRCCLPTISRMSSRADTNHTLPTIAAATPTPTTITTSSPPLVVRAKRTRDVAACGERLRHGGLVAFPTETVYGLGGHALDPDACRQIFAAKERPFTDPLIAHVLDFDRATVLWAARPASSEYTILQALAQAFWPGPLTLVARASPLVPGILTAGTLYCAVRSPRHAVARDLLQAAHGLAIAAPSANKFGHVSPTSADHVWDDLRNEDVWILEEEQQQYGNDDGAQSRVGVESTVVKLAAEPDGTFSMAILRQGAVGVAHLEAALALVGLDSQVKVMTQSSYIAPDDQAVVAPGQTIRHYSPHVPSFLISPACQMLAADASLLKAVVIDFGGRMSHWRDACLAYRDLSETASSSQAAQVVFDTLRWAECVDGATRILFPELGDTTNDALFLAVQDRLRRAASGVVLDSL